MNKPAAIYARVSSDRQKESHTIASQTAALLAHASAHGYAVTPEWVFEDEGYSGAMLARPGLETLRDLAAQGQIGAVLIYSPDRLSRICLPDFACRRVIALRRRTDLLEVSIRRHARRPTGRAVPRNDRRVRTRADCRALPPWKTPQGATGNGERALRRALRISVCSQE